MFELRVEARFAAGHRLMNSGTRCESPHGHNYTVEVFAEGTELDTHSMVLDFQDLKDPLEKIVRREWDHKFLLNSEDQAMRSALEPLFPDSVFLFQEENPTAEVMARYLFLRLMETGVPLVRTRVWETDRNFAEYSARA